MFTVIAGTAKAGILKFDVVAPCPLPGICKDDPGLYDVVDVLTGLDGVTAPRLGLNVPGNEDDAPAG